MKKSYQRILILVSLWFLFLGILGNASLLLSESVRYSILFLTKFFPVSFLLFLLSRLLLEYGMLDFIQRLFPKNSTRFYVFLVSLFSGVPAGAKTIVSLWEKQSLGKEEGNALLYSSFFPNLLFLFGSVSQVVEKNICWKIFFAIFFSNLVLFFLYSKKGECSISSSSKPFYQALQTSIEDAIHTMILIYGISLFFFVIGFLGTHYFSMNSFLYVYWNGLFDLTNGVFSTTLISSLFWRSFTLLFFLSFGGISIHMQVGSILQNSPFSYFSFLKGRVLGLAFSMIFFLFFWFF